MEYKLIATDLDDTLLNKDLNISYKNKEAIQKAIDKGVYFIITSGRPTPSSLPFYKMLGLNTPLIAYQGGKVLYPLTGEILLENDLSKDLCQKTIDFARKNNLHLNLFANDKTYIEKPNKWSAYYSGISKVMDTVEVDSFESFDFSSLTKIIIMDENKRLLDIKPELTAILGDEACVYISKPVFLEVTAQNANKGYALSFLANYMNVKREEIIAIGDSENDILMIEYAGLGVYVENTREDLKKHADFITSSNEEDGVAKVIQKFIL